MYRASTPTLYFHIKNMESLADIDKINLSFRNKDDVTNILEKTEQDIVIDEENLTLSVTLSQEETLLFKEKYVKVQFRIKMNSGAVIPSKEVLVDVHIIPTEDCVETYQRTSLIQQNFLLMAI